VAPADSKTIRVLLVDDHEIVRQGVRALVEGALDMTVVGEAADAEAALARALEVRPDVITLDLTMPGMSGLSAARSLKKVTSAAIVVVTRHADDAFVQEVIAAGAAGYVLKQSPSEELLRAIRTVAAGGQHLDAALKREARDPRRRRATAPVTEREQEVLRLTALGHANKEIAARLNISVKTVEVHKTNAMRKLNLRGRSDVVRYAVMKEWLRDT
jgi:DNA-binding NarL/FixJ family response regulator